MGAGVAYVSAYAGIDVVLIDRDQEGADKGKQHAADLLAKRVKRNKMTQEKADEITDRITATTDYKHLKDVDLIVEAVFENSELKAKITLISSLKFAKSRLLSKIHAVFMRTAALCVTSKKVIICSPKA